MNRGRVITAFFLICGWSMMLLPAQTAKIASTPSASPEAVLKQYCVTCHNQKLKTAGLMLDSMDLARVGENAAVWEKVVRKLRAREMPPAGMPRPNEAGYGATIGWLETQLDNAAAAHPNAGRVAVHR